MVISTAKPCASTAPSAWRRARLNVRYCAGTIGAGAGASGVLVAVATTATGMSELQASRATRQTPSLSL